jgi:hypothetical protein
MVPLETPIRSPATSCESSSKSTRRSASSSAGSRKRGVGFCCGFGENEVAVGVFCKVMGLGSLPLCPCLCRQPMVVHCLYLCGVIFIYFVHYHIIE